MIGERQMEAAGDLPGATARPGRAITQRSGLPTGRAVVGALLVTLAVVGLFLAYRRSQQGPDTSYVVLRTRVEAGQRIAAEDLTTRAMELAEDVASRAMTSTDEAIDAIALETLLPAQLLQSQAILPAGESEQSTDEIFELSFGIERARALSGDLKPGERVDVVATIEEGGEACTTVVASDVRVVATQGGSSGDTITATNNRLTLTLALEDPGQVLAAVFAVDEADVTVIRSTRSGTRLLTGAFCGVPTGDPAADAG